MTRRARALSAIPVTLLAGLIVVLALVDAWTAFVAVLTVCWSHAGIRIAQRSWEREFGASSRTSPAMLSTAVLMGPLMLALIWIDERTPYTDAEHAAAADDPHPDAARYWPPEHGDRP